tara:strand:- start:5852 stop:6172 length:321 start_codon:yes stop_codon:yes gene_type:complete
MACSDQNQTKPVSLKDSQTVLSSKTASPQETSNARNPNAMTIRVLTPSSLHEEPDPRSSTVGPVLPAGFAIAELREEQKDWLSVCISANKVSYCGYILKANTNWSS